MDYYTERMFEKCISELENDLESGVISQEEYRYRFNELVEEFGVE